MKRTLQTLFFALMAMMMPIGLSAHDFEVGGIYYNITSAEDKTVEVTFSGTSNDAVADEYTGEVIIPATVTYEGVTYSVASIRNNAFMYCRNLTSVTILEGVTTIGRNAFYECTRLTSIIIPESVTTIGNYAFSDCTRLTSITIPEGVTTIKSGAFFNCSGLTSITIPESVTSIGSSAFSNCAFLSSNFINNSSCTDEENWDAMFYTEDEEVDGMIIKDNVLVLARGTLTSANIPNNVTSIKEYAFYCCTALTSVNIPESVTEIGTSAFENTSLTSVTIPGCVQGFYGAFIRCSLLESVIISEGVTTISGSAFRECSSLVSISIPSSVTSISDNAFNDCISLASITIPESVTSIGRSALSGTQWLANQADGVVYVNNMAYTYKGEMPENCAIEIAEGTTTICRYAFEGLKNLASVTIPRGVTTILDYAFYECANLSSVKLTSNIRNIGGYAFAYTKLSTIVIPEGVETLGWGVFYQCTSLTSIAIPNSMEDIGRLSFEGCTALKEVHYNGTAAQWNAITIGDTNAPLNSATRHYCVDGYCPECGVFIFGCIIRDGHHTAFAIAEEVDVPSITYTRTLPNLEWNALYVPFEIPVNELLDNYDVAYFNNMHAYDRDVDGAIDEMEMEVIFIKEGTLHANHPYFIRAKSEAAKELTLELSDATLYSTAEEHRTSITTSSAYMEFTLAGVYEQKAGEDGVYAINTEGAWSPIAEGAKLNPFRLFLQMTTRSGSPVKVDASAAKAFRIRAIGNETTGIEHSEFRNQNSELVYDLMGRRVLEPQKGGIYIVDGKKVVW